MMVKWWLIISDHLIMIPSTIYQDVPVVQELGWYPTWATASSSPSIVEVSIQSYPLWCSHGLALLTSSTIPTILIQRWTSMIGTTSTTTTSIIYHEDHHHCSHHITIIMNIVIICHTHHYSIILATDSLLITQLLSIFSPVVPNAQDQDSCSASILWNCNSAQGVEKEKRGAALWLLSWPVQRCNQLHRCNDGYNAIVW